jgi:WXXGXW repeat (2 copies)
MNLDRSMLVAVAMMVGSFSAMGCKQGSVAQDSAPAADNAPAEVASATTDVASQAVTSPGVAQDENGVRYARPAPPALRLETPGRAPSAHHVWQRGFWRFDTVRTVYLWEPGYWVDQTAVATYAPLAVRYEDPGFAPGAEFVFVPGFWRWDSHDYRWVGGHWAGRRDAGYFVRPHFVAVNGHWENHPVRFVDRRDGDRRGGEHRDADRHEADKRGGEHRATVNHLGAGRATTPIRRGHG